MLGLWLGGPEEAEVGGYAGEILEGQAV